MRAAHTYRAARREAAKAERQPWPAFWHAQAKTKPDYHPQHRKPGEYMPHQGEQERARRVRQMATQRSN